MLLILITIITIKLEANTDNFNNTIIKIARAEIGNGENGKNNSGYHVKKYLNGHDNLSWCAGFVSYCIESAGSTFDYNLSARAIFNAAKAKNLITKTPITGDIIVFWKDSKSSWRGHCGIISKVSDENIWVIEGNVGKFPARVKEFKYKRNNIPKLLGFVRIEE